MRAKTALLATMLSGAAVLPMAASATMINGVNLQPGATFVLSNLFEEAVPSVNADGSYTNVFGNTISSASGSNFVASSKRTITAQGQILRGIGSISEIDNGSGQAVWSNGNNNTFLTLAFDNYVAENVASGNGTISIDFSGGLVNFYTSATNTFNANVGGTTDGNTSDEFATVTSGTPWLTMTGANIGTSTDSASFDGSGVPLTLHGTATGSLISIGAGSGSGLFDVTGGPAAYTLNTNTFPNGADVSIDSSFNSAPPLGDFKLSGSTTQKFNAIPEPTPIAILAVGLLGLAFLKRKKDHKRLG